MLARFERSRSCRKQGGYDGQFHRDLVTPGKSRPRMAVFNSSTERLSCPARFAHTIIVMCHLNDIVCRHLRLRSLHRTSGRERRQFRSCRLGAAYVPRRHAQHRSAGQAVLPGGSLGSGGEPLCLGLSGDHRQPVGRFRAAAVALLAHHRRHRPGRGSARRRRRRRPARTQSRRQLSIHVRLPALDAVRHHGRPLHDAQQAGRDVRHRHPRLLAGSAGDSGGR